MGLVKKLFIKKDYRAAVVNEPAGFALPEEELPEGVSVSTGKLDGAYDFLLMFAKNQEELKRFTPQIINHLKDEAMFWVAYPKKSSKLKSDITRDSGWENLQEAGYVGVSLISVDDTWSAFRLRKAEHVGK